MEEEKNEAPEKSDKGGGNSGSKNEGHFDKSQKHHEHYDRKWAPQEPRMQAPFPWPDPPDEKKE